MKVHTLPQGQLAPTGLLDRPDNKPAWTGDFQGGTSTWRFMERARNGPTPPPKGQNPALLRVSETHGSIKAFPGFPSLIPQSARVQSHLYQPPLCTATGSPPRPKPTCSVQPPSAPQATVSQQHWAPSSLCPKPTSPLRKAVMMIPKHTLHRVSFKFSTPSSLDETLSLAPFS